MRVSDVFPLEAQSSRVKSVGFYLEVEHARLV
jgi:hypothetical protein